MKKSNTLIFFFFLGIAVIFFYPIFLGKIPFPGDLLISEYSPWKYTSFLGFAPGAFPEKFQYFDVLRQMYPWTTFIIQSFKSFSFPLWNPYNFSGTPLFANSQSAVLYPLHILYFLLPQTITWTILVTLQPMLASLFTFLYARKIGIGKWGSMLSAVAFGYSLFLSVFLEYNTIDQVTLFLPLLLLLVEYFLERKSFLITILIPLGVACSFFAGHIQIFGFLLLFTIIYVLVRSLFSNKQKNVLWILWLILLGIGITSMQLLPTFELIANAARSPLEYTLLVHNLLLQPQQALLFLSPDIFGNPATRNYLLSDSYPGNAVYIGFIPFLFALYSLSLWKKQKYIVFFATSSAILLLLFFNSPITQLFYRINIPLFSTGSPTNAIFLLSFCLSILAGFGLEKWLVQEDKYKILFLLGGLLVVFLLGIGLLKVAHLPFITNSAIYTMGIGIVVFLLLFTGLTIKSKQQLACILIIITLLDLFYFFGKFNPFSPQPSAFPLNPVISFVKSHQGVDRFYSYGNALIESNIATQFGMYDANGYDPLYPKWYGSFIESAKNGKIPQSFSNQDRSDAALPAVYTATDILSNSSLQKALKVLGIKYIVSKDDPTTYKLPQEKFDLMYNNHGWQIFSNKEALPRVFLAYKAEQYMSGKDFENKFYSNTFNPRTTILLNSRIDTYRQGVGNAIVTSYTPNKVTITSSSTTKGLLFLSDTYYPGWKATVDGEDTRIIKADYAFRSVIIPSGKHIVIFSYQPYSFSLGLTLTIISLGMLILTEIIVRMQYEK